MNHAAAQCFTLDEFGGNKVCARLGADFVNCEDVWVIESRRGFCFLHKTLHAQRI